MSVPRRVPKPPRIDTSDYMARETFSVMVDQDPEAIDHALDLAGELLGLCDGTGWDAFTIVALCEGMTGDIC